MKKKPSKQAVILRRHAEKCKKFMPPDEFQPLVSGLTSDQIAELAGVTVGTVRRWLSGSTPIPYAVQQLFRLRAHGVVGKDCEALRVDAVKAEELAGYYRRQVQLEASMGLALMRVAG